MERAGMSDALEAMRSKPCALRDALRVMRAK
jgi:hypothetical protein